MLYHIKNKYFSRQLQETLNWATGRIVRSETSSGINITERSSIWPTNWISLIILNSKPATTCIFIERLCVIWISFRLNSNLLFIEYICRLINWIRKYLCATSRSSTSNSNVEKIKLCRRSVRSANSRNRWNPQNPD